jgi:hypothetical protein
LAKGELFLCDIGNRKQSARTPAAIALLRREANIAANTAKKTAMALSAAVVTLSVISSSVLNCDTSNVIARQWANSDL